MKQTFGKMAAKSYSLYPTFVSERKTNKERKKHTKENKERRKEKERKRKKE